MIPLRVCACVALCLALIGCSKDKPTAPRPTVTGHVVVRAYTIDGTGTVTDSVDYASVSGIKVRLLSDTATVSTADSAITVNGAFSFTRWTAGRFIAVGCVRGFPIDSTGPIVVGSSSTSFPAPLILGTYGPIRTYPNPMTTLGQLHFSLDSARTCHLIVTTMSGEVVRTLASQFFAAGVHLVGWDGRTDSSVALSPGIYWGVLDWRSGAVSGAPRISPAGVGDIVPVPGNNGPTPPVSCTVIVKQ